MRGGRWRSRSIEGEDVYKRQDTYEAQPTDEMEVITINNIETSTDEIPHVEPEKELIVSDQPDRPSEEARWDHMMRMMMEQFGQVKEDGKKSHKKLNDSMNKTTESINKNIESLKEDLNKRIDNTHKSMDALNSKIDDNRQACLLYTSRCV